MGRMPRVLVLFAHPDLRLSRVNQRLRQVALEQPQERVELRDLYALYPDHVIDVAEEQAAAARADLIVWQHPIHWYSMPALMKQWLDEVLTLGWAYGPGGTALHGKDLWLVASTGGPEAAYHSSGYNRYFFDAFLPPYEQTGVLCGLRFLPPLLLHGAHGVSHTALEQHAAEYATRLATYPDWPEMDLLDPCPTCEVPALDRPVEPA
jgi:glutathione-regulated potassium-efflux system ancillary protein KefF